MKITEKQKIFILKAINNINVLFDFDLSEKEFKDYGINKKDLIKEIKNLKEVLKWTKNF